MFVKRVLIFLPVLFLLFLAQSVLWVPSAASVAEDESRLNRHIIYLSGNVTSMNPWLGASAGDSDVFTYIFESLFAYNGDFKLEYELAEQAHIAEEIVINLDSGMAPETIADGLTAFLKETYPDTFDKITAAKDYDQLNYQGWNEKAGKGRYIVDRSGDTKLAADSIPDDDRFMAPYRPKEDDAKLPEDGIKRLVIHLRPDPDKAYDYKNKHEVPSAIASDIKKQLTSFFEDKLGLFGVISSFDSELSGANWYLAKHGEKPIRLSMPSFNNTIGEEVEGNGVEEPEKGEEEIAPPEDRDEGKKPEDQDEDGSSDGDEAKEESETESESDEDAEAKPDANSDEGKIEASAGKPELPQAKVVFKAETFKKQLDEIKNFKKTVLALLKKAYEDQDKAPEKAAVEVWLSNTKRNIEDAMKRVKEVEESTKTKLADFLNKAPKTRYSEHPLVKLKLRKDVKWQDFGKEIENGPHQGSIVKEYVDSGDIAFSYAFGHHPDVNSKRKTYSTSIRQIRIHDDHQVDFLYNEVYSPAILDLAVANIIPEHKFRTSDWIAEAKKKGRGPEPGTEETYQHVKEFPPTLLRFQQDPVGSGPMTLHGLNGKLLPKWKSGELIRLERFDDYWNPENKPVYQFLDFYIFDPDLGQETAEVVFLSGGTDQYSVRAHQVSKFEADREDYYLYKTPNLRYEYIAFNMENEFFSDLKVRQALTMAVNVDDLVKYIVFGQAQRVNQPAYPMLPYYDQEFVPDYTFRGGEHKGKNLKDAGLQGFPFDLEEAGRLLDEAGWKLGPNGVRVKDGKEFRFEILNGGQESSARGKVAKLAIEQWKRLGVMCEFKSKEFNVFLSENIYPRNFDAVTLGWSGGLSFDKRQLWHSKFLAPGGLNFIGFKDKKADQIMEDLLKEYTEEGQIKLARELNAHIANQCPYIFLFSNLSSVAVSRSLYWAKPVKDADGNLILDENRNVKREPRPITDRDLIALKNGPKTKRLQYGRSKEYQFKQSEDELMQVGAPNETWKSYYEAKKRAAEQED